MNSKSGFVAAALALLLVWSPAQAQRTADGWYAQGQTQLKAGQFAQAVTSFEKAAGLNPSAANYRWLAEAAVGAGNYARASQAYDQAIKGYRARNDSVTANALAAKAAPYRQEASFFIQGAAPDKLLPDCARTLAKFEPLSGLYLGLYVNEQGLAANGDLRVGGQLGRKLAVYFRYFKLRDPRGLSPEEIFPVKFAQAARAAGGSMHLALEPGVPLSEISEASLTPFAQAARAAGIPIFLRFAGEFNDPGNAWSRDAALYRTKFRLVHDVMARVAPNVAMVWMPMPSRLEVIDAYFPGDDAVDWVGISLYSVPFRNGDTGDSTLNQNPLDVLKPFYDKYACAHPFQISEFASSHRSEAKPGVDYTDFAVDKLRTLFWGAYLKYPRLKNINWLDLDMIGGKFVQNTKTTERQNDYSLFASAAKLGAFRELFKEPYFLTTAPGQAAASIPHPALFPSSLRVTGDVKGALYLKTFAPATVLALSLDGISVPTLKTLPYSFTLSAARLTPGKHTLKLVAKGANGQILIDQTQVFTVQP
jgi:tetratricopeptide (TPR) repeat protein